MLLRGSVADLLSSEIQPSATTHRPWTVAALLLALAMAAMEMTVVSTAMPTVVGDLGGAEHYAWVFSAYMLTSTVTVPIYGKLADLYGRKPVMLAAIALFLLGSMASGQARTMTQLIGFRAVQGVGAGGMQPIALTIVGDIFTLEERAKMQGVFGAVWAIAGLVGPLLGGLIVGALSWRWVFYVNVPFGLLSAVILSFFHAEKLERHDHKLDVLGAVVLSGAIVALLLGVDSPFAAILLPLCVLLTGAFLFVETRVSEPLVPLRLFAQRTIATSSAIQSFAGGSMVGLVTFAPLYAQGVLGATPTQAGVAIAPMAIAWPIASAFSGRVLTRIGFRPLIRGGAVLITATAVAFAVCIANGAQLGTLRLLSALFGLGMGLSNTSLVIAVQSSVGFSQRGVATASTMFFRNIGGTIGVGVMGAVLARHLTSTGSDSTLVARMLGPERRNLDPNVLRESASGLAHGLVYAAWIIAAFAACSLVSALLFPAISHKSEPSAKA